MTTERLDDARDLLLEKLDLRRRMRALRDALPEAGREAAAASLAEHLERWLARACRMPAPGAALGSFLPIGSEIDPRPAAARLAARGALVAVPAIREGELVFRRLGEAEALEPQGFGTLAPGEAAPVLEPLVLLVPLLAFDGAGRRIGYGRGFYDRAIARLRAARADTLAVGVGFEAQRVERVPVDGHDEALDAVLTESGAWVPSEPLPAAGPR